MYTSRYEVAHHTQTHKKWQKLFASCSQPSRHKLFAKQQNSRSTYGEMRMKGNGHKSEKSATEK